ncbi:MAG: hypothetical protein J2P36_01960 [Ktedonobacteraceae bacterium]|nr:hypothetical protein [Ktedonobacteraceae bacterium]
MYHTTDRPAMGRVVLVQGAIFGGIMCGVKLVIVLLNFVTGMTGRLFYALSSALHLSIAQTSLINTIFWIIVYGAIGLVVFLFAGMQAARRTGKMESGVLAGLLGGGIYGIFSLLLGLVLFFAITLPAIERIHPPSEGLITSLLVSNVISSVGVDLVVVGLIVGSLAGLLGGAIGRSSARQGMMPQYGAMPVPMPPPGQPYGAPSEQPMQEYGAMPGMSSEQPGQE